jgi:DNA-binding transcriptional MerR regulator
MSPSRGLIDPERTASGYRKFYDNDVDLLRVILREQRENFLPLRVIRDRLESGAIEDPTGPTTPPRGIRNVQVLEHPADDIDDDADLLDATPSDVPLATRHHPAGQGRQAPAAETAVVETVVPTNHEAAASPPRQADDAHDRYSSADLCQTAGLTTAQLDELESYGLLAGKGSGASRVYATTDLAIAKAAAAFMQHGVEGRHLRAWRQAAEREASLFEQMILPLLRQRNPQARQQAVSTLTTLTSLGSDLRSAIVRSALSHHLDA